jgi:hypothetical protein
VTFDLDIYRAAKLLIDRHGDEAALYAVRRADLLLEEGDTEGATTWRAFARAIEELRRDRGRARKTTEIGASVMLAADLAPRL